MGWPQMHLSISKRMRAPCRHDCPVNFEAKVGVAECMHCAYEAMPSPDTNLWRFSAGALSLETGHTKGHRIFLLLPMLSATISTPLADL
jgi:hypothetical protein